jgi:hypothetical protein
MVLIWEGLQTDVFILREIYIPMRLHIKHVGMYPLSDETRQYVTSLRLNPSLCNLSQIKHIGM